MQTFSFIIKGRPFTFLLESREYGPQTFVITNVYRHSKCTEHKINPQSPLASAFMGDQALMEKDEFEKDLRNQVKWINESHEEPSTQIFFDACCKACHQHIARCGRLFISDMFSYLDVFALLLNTYFGQSKEQTTYMYLECTKVLGHALNQYVKCPVGYGNFVDFDTWAKRNEF